MLEIDLEKYLRDNGFDKNLKYCLLNFFKNQQYIQDFDFKDPVLTMYFHENTQHINAVKDLFKNADYIPCGLSIDLYKFFLKQGSSSTLLLETIYKYFEQFQDDAKILVDLAIKYNANINPVLISVIDDNNFFTAMRLIGYRRNL